MSFLAKISLDGGTAINVLNCSYRFRKATDAANRPIAVVRPGGFVHLVVESTGDTELFDWMIDPTAIKSGTITFYRRDMMSKSKILHFTDAYCVDYYETYYSEGEHPMRIALTLSAMQLEFNAERASYVPAYAPQGVEKEGVIEEVTNEKSLNVVLKAGAPGSPEHKAQRWNDYQENGGKWSYDRWSKQYDVNMRNVKRGLAREQEYLDAMKATSKTVKTPKTNRQIDIFDAESDYMGQLKTGKMYLTKQAKIDILKDKTLVDQGYTVEHILENDASKPYIEALKAAQIKYHIGPKIP